ncbi:hypothetical protein O181_117700, partial [Austropuccinia psidii MF-1]|nr:hypothetical protein [Austropuccinia psidii MF-1]
MTRKQTCAMGQGQLTLYSLVLQPPLCSNTITRPHVWVSPASVPRQQPTLVMLADKHTRNDSFVVDDYEAISKREWTPGPQAGRQEQFWTISPVPSSIDLSTPPPRPPSDGHFTPRPERSDYPANEGWRWKEDIRAWADCHHVLSPMGFKRQKPNPPNPPRQDSPVPTLPREQTPRQPTPGPSGTRWSEDLFR